MVDDLKNSGEWKMHLTMKPKFMSSAVSNKNHTMYSKSDNSIVVNGSDTHEIIVEPFYSLLHKYQIGLKQSMKCSNFTFE